MTLIRRTAMAAVMADVEGVEELEAEAVVMEVLEAEELTNISMEGPRSVRG